MGSAWRAAALAPVLRCRHASAGAHSTAAHLYYQAGTVPRSITSTGQVFTNRDRLGSDAEFVGVEYLPTAVTIEDGRDQGLTLDENGFCLVKHALERHVDYFDNHAILNDYYGACEKLVLQQTGASSVLAFDHNLRAKQRKEAADMLKGEGASAVQEPFVNVHNDYTLASSARRIEQLGQPLGVNDTLRAVAAVGSEPAWSIEDSHPA